MKITKRTMPSTAIAQQLQTDFGKIIASCMLKAGVSTKEEAIEYLADFSTLDFADTKLIPDIEKVCDIITDAIMTGKNICIFGDYDADGITASSILQITLKALGSFPLVVLPSRDRGYGLQINDVEYIRKEGAELLITVDCGIKCINEIDIAKSYGITTIILDHHLAGDTIPKADAIIDLHWNLGKYPDKNLTGAGLAYMVSRHLCKGILDEQITLDLAALGTIADVENIGKGENRKIVKKALNLLHTGDSTTHHYNDGVMELCGGKADTITAEELAFLVAPKVNACGRLHTEGAYKPLNLFCGLVSDPQEAAKEISETNEQRKEIQSACVEEVTKQAQMQIDLGYKVLVCLSTNAKAGIVGLLAGNLKEEFSRPAIVFCRKGNSDILVASARSIEGYNIVAELDKVKSLLLGYGGHELAAGMSLQESNLTAFTQEINKNCKLTDAQIEPRFEYDFEISESDANNKDVMLNIAIDLARCEPFGAGNPKPVFKVKCFTEPINKAAYSTVGNKGQHLVLKLKGCDGQFRAIGFNMVNKYVDLGCPCEFDGYGTISVSNYNGDIVLTLAHIEAEKPKQTQLMDDISALLNF